MSGQLSIGVTSPNAIKDNNCTLTKKEIYVTILLLDYNENQFLGEIYAK